MRNSAWKTLFVLLLYTLINVIKCDNYIGSIILLPLSSWFQCSTSATSSIRYLVTVSTQQLQGTPNFGYFINNHKFYDTSEPCTEGILANAMPAVNLLEDMSLNTTFYSWNAVSCYQDCVTTCPKTDNDGLNYTTWCLLVSNIKNTVDYVNITLSFDSPSASTSLPGTVPVYNSGSKETVLSVWFLTAFGLTGILGGLGLFIL